MSIIYQLKGALSINDIKITLDGINKKVVKEDINLESFYNGYLKLTNKNVSDFKEDIDSRINMVKDESLEDGNSPDLEHVLMISSLVHMSNLYRRVAEKLVDEIVVEKEVKRQR